MFAGPAVLARSESRGGPRQVFGQPGVPDNAYLRRISLEETMNLNLLKKIAMWALAVGAVLISPVILVYGVAFGFGIVSDIVQLSGGPIIPVDLIASPVAYLMLRRAPAPAAV
jgi:uncharacterized membrane protein YedE/YeeE